MARSEPRTFYTRAELVSDGIVHVIGLVLVLIAVPILITLAILSGGAAWTIAAAAVYGVSVILMLSLSALYNMAPNSTWTGLFQRLDHSAIYLKIAGTFTPLAVIAGASTGLLGAIWGAALTGICLKMKSPRRYRMVGLALYLGMGWLGVAFGWHAFSSLSGTVLALIAVGGLLYTAGVVFHLWNSLPFHNTIWHVFVLTATILFYAAILSAVLMA